jgi:phosphatidylinositol 4-kinase
MVEVLRDDFSFDPEAPENEQLLKKLMSEHGGNRRRIFDLADAPRRASLEKIPVKEPDSVFEPAQGDLGFSELIKSDDEDVPPYPNIIRVPSPATTQYTAQSFNSNPTPRTSAGTSHSGSSSPGHARKGVAPFRGSGAKQPPTYPALATHIRTAAQMLTQLESTSGKRPKAEVETIRAKIIASMQSMEEHSFDVDNPVHVQPTFDSIMANANVASSGITSEDLDDLTADLNPTGAGATRMENDLKTGGVQRKGDRDDPSAAMFGEAWSAKKERIRKASPYGWMPNWDLVSVIVKTGADLRQEAFAVQLIEVCDKIWKEANTPVWVKRMRILVTGEGSGLIETITNGVSLHSIKRSLTLATIESGQNPRGRIASLKDHFVKAFGEPDTDAYKAAQTAFKRSLAAYSIISYILQLKDRHNGNVLIDDKGHIIHIDFGFMLSNSPGSVGFEAAPFKLTQDYVDVLGGVGSQAFEDYKQLCKQAFQGKLSLASPLQNPH